MLEKLEKLADVPPIAWQYWICVDPAKAQAAAKVLPRYEPSQHVYGHAADFVRAVRGALAGRSDAETLEREIMRRYTALHTNRERAQRARYRAAVERQRSKRRWYRLRDPPFVSATLSARALPARPSNPRSRVVRRARAASIACSWLRAPSPSGRTATRPA